MPPQGDDDPTVSAYAATPPGCPRNSQSIELIMESTVEHDTGIQESIRTRRALLAKGTRGLALTAGGLFLPAWLAEADAQLADDDRDHRDRSRRRRDKRDRRKDHKRHKRTKGDGGKQDGSQKLKCGGEIYEKKENIQFSIVNSFSDQEVPGGYLGELWVYDVKDKKGKCYFNPTKVEEFAVPTGTTATDPVTLQTDEYSAIVWFPGRRMAVEIFTHTPKAWFATLSMGGSEDNQWHSLDYQFFGKKITEAGLSGTDDADGIARKVTIKKGELIDGYRNFILEIGPANS
jgi:hypothetical protein